MKIVAGTENPRLSQGEATQMLSHL